MSHLDPAVAAALRTALGLRDSDDPDLIAAAATMTDAADAARPSDAAMLLLAASLVRQLRARGVTFRGAREVLAAETWPVRTTADHTALTATLLTLAAAWATDGDVETAAEAASDLP